MNKCNLCDTPPEDDYYQCHSCKIYYCHKCISNQNPLFVCNNCINDICEKCVNICSNCKGCFCDNCYPQHLTNSICHKYQCSACGMG